MTWLLSRFFDAKHVFCCVGSIGEGATTRMHFSLDIDTITVESAESRFENSLQ